MVINWVYSTYEDRCYATWDGTSFAVAAFSGAIAYLRQNEEMSGDEAEAWLKIPPGERKALSGPAAMDDIRPA
jgi:subtilase family protein